MIDLPEKFRAYSQQVAEQRHNIELAKAKILRIEALMEAQKYMLDNLKTNEINADIAKMRNEIYWRMEELKREKATAESALEEINGISDIANEAVEKMNI